MAPISKHIKTTLEASEQPVVSVSVHFVSRDVSGSNVQRPYKELLSGVGRAPGGRGCEGGGGEGGGGSGAAGDGNHGKAAPPIPHGLMSVAAPPTDTD